MVFQKVLNSPIPFGGWGRLLTSTEVQSLKKLGYRVTRRFVVIRIAHDEDSRGIVYEPEGRTGLSKTHIYVETK